MSINAFSVYNTLSYFYRDTLILKIDGPFSGDLIAGTIAALTLILPTLYKNERDLLDNNIIISPDPVDRNNPFDYRIFQILSDWYKLLGNYVINTGVPVDQFNNYNQMINDYGWWVTQQLYNTNYGTKYEFYTQHTLYKFSSIDFIQGFISTFDSFNLNFRNFILGGPFKYNSKTKQIITIEIEGYDIEPFTIKSKIPAPIGPYYTGIYEADPDAVDFD